MLINVNVDNGQIDFSTENFVLLHLNLKVMKRLGLLLVFLLLMGSLFAQKNSGKGKDNYFYLRGVEVLQNDDLAQAVNYFAQALEQEPDNGYAWVWLGAINYYYTTPDYDEANRCFNKALLYLPKKDKALRVKTLLLASQLHIDCGSYAIAYNYLAEAQQLDKKNPRVYTQLGELYYQSDIFDASDQCYKTAKKYDKENPMIDLGIARNALARNLFAKAMDLLNDIIAKYSDYSEAYAYRSVAYFATHSSELGAKDLVTAFSLGDSDKAFIILKTLRGADSEAMQMALKKQLSLEPNNPHWLYLLAVAADVNGQTQKSLDCYLKLADLQDVPDVNSDLARCYFNMGEFEKSITHCTLALDNDESDIESKHRRAWSYFELNNIDSASNDLVDILLEHPHSAAILFSLAQFHQRSGRLEEAIKDISASLEYDSTSAVGYLVRGEIYQQMGEEAKARRDFLTAIKYDRVADEGQVSQFAYFYIGNMNEAVKIENEILAENGNSRGNLADAARFYALIGDNEKALSYLRSAIEAGYHLKQFTITDPAFAKLRTLPEFDILW